MIDEKSRMNVKNKKKNLFVSIWNAHALYESFAKKQKGMSIFHTLASHYYLN